jgi:chromate transporter
MEEVAMNKAAEIFVVFIKIGTFTIGTGHAMIPLIQQEVVEKKKYISEKEFADMLAIAQSAPGPVAVDIAVFIGFRVAGLAGSIAAVTGAIFTAFLCLLLIAMFFPGLKNSHAAEAIFTGIRPAVVALIAVPVISLAKTCNINRKNIFIPLAAAFLITAFSINPIYIIIAAIVGGLIFGFFTKKYIR